jgi:HEAT repeat protein
MYSPRRNLAKPAGKPGKRSHHLNVVLILFTEKLKDKNVCRYYNVADTTKALSDKILRLGCGCYSKEDVMGVSTNKYLTTIDQAKSTSRATPATVAGLVAALKDDDRITRQRARETMVNIGRPCVAPLIKVLSNPKSDERLRWEATAALSKINAPNSAPVLVKALEDDSFGIRWLAAEGLINLGRQGIPALLEALLQRSESVWLRQGAHHILRTLARTGLPASAISVLQALEDVEPAVEVIQPAKSALKALKTSTNI